MSLFEEEEGDMPIISINLINKNPYYAYFILKVDIKLIKGYIRTIVLVDTRAYRNFIHLNLLKLGGWGTEAGPQVKGATKVPTASIQTSRPISFKCQHVQFT